MSDAFGAPCVTSGVTPDEARHSRTIRSEALPCFILAFGTACAAGSRFMENIDNVKIEDSPPKALPGCPYCEKDLDTIWVKTSRLGFKGQKEILMCPHCQSFLGYNAWKR